MPTGETPPSVTSEAFGARLRALKLPSRFALAVSGGRDSMALARLAAVYGQDTGAEIFAYSVDHGLRAEAAAETARAAVWCEAIGLTHRTLKWIGEKPASGVQAAARAARYRLLAEAAAKDRCGALLTAHSADDQAETVFMRLARGAGLYGLSAMRTETRIAAGSEAPVRLLRPLLGFTRAQLTATVENAGQAYIDDPSNEDPVYERVRMRALLAALEEQNLLTGAALNRTADRLGQAAARLRQQEDDLFDALGGCFYSWGGASIDKLGNSNALGGLSARLIHAVSGEPHAPDEMSALSALQAANRDGAATLGGTLVKFWKARMWFLREPGAVLGRGGVAPIKSVAIANALFWDGRFILRPENGATGLTAAPIGFDRGALGPAITIFSGPGEAISTSPGIYQGGALTGAPAFPFMASGGVRAEPLVKERFSGGIIRF